jgi:tRNA-2-methylthio-N6-dimethylallyladenosine synthase
LLEEVRYDSLFSFKYSPRPNTPSLAMPDAISEEEKSGRLAVLQEKQREIQSERNATLVNTVFDVLVSGKSRRENQWSGHTSCHRVVNFTSQQQNLLGTYVQVQVTGAGPNSLVGAQLT